MLTAVTLVALACSDGAEEEDDAGTQPGAVTTEGISGTVVIEVTDIDHPVTGDGVEPIGSVVEIITDGTVEAGASVTVDAGTLVGDDEIVVAVIAESEDGPWEPLPVTVAGTLVTASIEHLSLFSFLRFPDPVGILEELFDDLTSDLSAAATAPLCDEEDGARADGYEILSEGPDVLLWCLGREGEDRYLRVVNNRRYPVILSSSIPVREADAAGAVGDRLAEVLAGDRIAVPPRAQVTFSADLEAGSGARVHAELDGLAYSLYQLQYGVELASAFLSHFGLQTPAPPTLEALFDNVGCVDALVASSPGRAFTSCLDYENLSVIFGSLGAAIATPILLATGVVSFFQTAAGSLWDEITGRDNYTVTLERQAIEPEVDASELERCRQSGTPGIGDPDKFERLAQCLYVAWQADDRELAQLFAEPAAIDELFGFQLATYRFDGCRVDSSRPSWLGNVCAFLDDSSDDHWYGFELYFIAYDDVAVVSAVQFHG